MTKHVVVTGANKGIGLNFCKQYVTKGYRVTAVVRSPSEELKALDIKIISDIDVANADDVTTLANHLHGDKIDILINNAGVFHNETLDDMDFSAIEKQLHVNAIAPVRVTHALLQSLGLNAKVAREIRLELLLLADVGMLGLGNTRFKSSVNRAPRQRTLGTKAGSTG